MGFVYHRSILIERANIRREYASAWILMLVLLSWSPIRAQDPNTEYYTLALRWAPFIYQDTDSEMGNDLQDYITNIYYDDNNPSNNWENIEQAPLNAYVYYSVVESDTHFFIGYYFYHPRDWEGVKYTNEPNTTLGEHEHDLEGVMLVVAKPANTPGNLELMYTQAHGDTYYFFPDSSNAPNVFDVPQELEDCLWSRDHRDHLYGNLQHCPVDESTSLYVVDDGRVGFGRAAVFIECRGHGVGQIARAMVPDDGGLFVFGGSRFAFRGGDGVSYGPAQDGIPEVPIGLNDEVAYALLPINDDFWTQCWSGNVFGDYVDITTQRGVSISGMGAVMLSFGLPGGGANPPWYWDEHSNCAYSGVCANADGAVRGDWLLDPAEFIRSHVSDYPALQLPGFSRYVDNIYLAGENTIVVATPLGLRVGVTETISWDAQEAAYPQTGMSDSCVVDLVAPNGSSVRLGGQLETASGSATIAIPSVPYGVYRLRIRAASDAGSFLSITGYSAPFVVASSIDISTGLVAFWPLNGNAVDESNNTNDGSVVGAVLTDDRHAHPSSAYYFDGLGDYIDCGDALNSLAVPFTFSAWILAQHQPGELSNRIFSSDCNLTDTGNYWGFWLYLYQNGKLNIGYGDGTGAESSDRRTKISDGVIPFGRWAHIVMVVRGPRDMTIYCNGEDAGGTYSGTSNHAMVHNSYPLRIGTIERWSSDGERWYCGALDEVRIYDRALTDAEVAELYTAEAPNNMPLIFCGEDPGRGLTPPGINVHPVADAARSEFQAYMVNYGVEDFESVVSGGNESVALNLGPVTASLNGGGYVSSVFELGTFAVSGARYWCDRTIAPFMITFAAPQTSFGFMATDIADHGGNVILIADGQREFHIPAVGTPGGNVLFYGFIDSDHPFSSIEFMIDPAYDDGFGVDDLMVGCAAPPSGIALDPGNEVSVEPSLWQNAPNPFNPLTIIRYFLPHADHTRLLVYDLAGRLIRTLVDADLPRGSHQATWDGRDASGRGMASGSYFARLEAGGRVETVRMSLVR